jgi:hypothetical protein
MEAVMGDLRVLQGSVDLATPRVSLLEGIASPAGAEGPSQGRPSHSGRFPAEWDALLLEAPFTAARRLCNAAIEHEAELVLLTGRLCQPELDRRGAWFLNEQFRRLHEAGIDVVCIAESKPEIFQREWTTLLGLPPNVRNLSARHSIGFRLTRSSRLVEIEWADVEGEQRVHGAAADLVIRIARTAPTSDPVETQSRAGRRQPPDSNVIQHRIEEPSRVNSNIAEESRAEQPPHSTETTVEYERQGAETPVVVPMCDGASPDGEEAQLVECHASGTCRVRPIPTAAVRRVDETVTITDSITWDELKQRMQVRLDDIHRQVTAEELLLVHWTLAGSGPLWERLLEPETVASLMREVRQTGVRLTPPVWSAVLTLSPSAEQFETWKESRLFTVAWEELEAVRSTAGRSDSFDGATTTGEAPAECIASPPHALVVPIAYSRLQLRLVRELLGSGRVA